MRAEHMSEWNNVSSACSWGSTVLGLSSQPLILATEQPIRLRAETKGGPVVSPKAVLIK